MAERKRRGLGRGLGALINSDSQEGEATGAAESVTVDVSHETSQRLETREPPAQDGTESTTGAEESGSDRGRRSGGSSGAEGHEGRDPDDASAESSASEEFPASLGTPTVAEAPAEDDQAVSPLQEAPERPIDVFFSAKSHLGTQRVSRGTRPTSRSSTTSRRAGGRRAEMPDVMSERHSARTAGSAASPVSPTPAPMSTKPPQDESGVANGHGSVPEETEQHGDAPAVSTQAEEDQHAWTESVSRNGHGGSVDGAEFRSIPVESIQPNPRQPRTEFDEDDMAELVHSVREIGVLQPIVVREINSGQYELVMGERRWRASKAADRAEIPAIVRSTKDDDLLRDALLENIHRSQLNPLEEAAAYRQLLDDFNCTQDQLAERIGRSRPQISNTLRLMKLPPAVQRRVAAGVLSSGHARALLGLSDPEEMEELAKRIVAEGLSVRATEEAVTMAQHRAGNGVSRGTQRLPSTARYQQLDEYADALTDRLDTQVKITLGAKKGRIAIDFGSIEDLHRLMEMIGQQQHVS